MRPVSFEGSQGPAQVAQFRVDVSENENAYTIRAEIPGVKKDEINISIEGDHVAISTEVKNEKDVKDGERVLRAERYYGKVYRAFQLGQPVDEDGASARYSDGILELTSRRKPRRARSASRSSKRTRFPENGRHERPFYFVE